LIFKMVIALTLTNTEIKALEQFDSSIMFAYPEMQSILKKVYESAKQEKNSKYQSRKEFKVSIE
jgi:hypothetical protein